MNSEKKFDVLFQILSSEQQILQRADQKAFTLLSILGVYSVFFIIHYTKIPPTLLNSIIIFFYFAAVLTTIYFLVLVVSPRIRNIATVSEENKITSMPTFFAGIAKYKSHEEYAAKLGVILENEDTTYEVFTNNVYSISRINEFKNRYLKYGISSFVFAVTLEFILIVSLYINLLLQS